MACVFFSHASTHGRSDAGGVDHDELPVERIVVNRTGLTGRYDVELRWTPDPGATAAADAPPGLVTAVREQLGLRLQSDTAPMEHLVIDSVERPQPD